MSKPDLATLTRLRGAAADDLSNLRYRHTHPHSFAIGGAEHPPDPWTEIGRAEERRLEELVASYDAAISSNLRSKGEGVAEASRVRWQSETWQWVDEILRWKEQGHISSKAESETAALTQVALHFLDKDGKPFNVRSALQSYKTHKTKRS